MLSTFSLMSTTLNAHSTSKTFKKKFGSGKTKSELKEAVEAAEYFLCGSQQSPLRIKEDKLQELFSENPEELRNRWLPLKQRLYNTRRLYTFSLFAQTFFGVVAWLLTIIGSYVTSLGQHSEALLLSSGTLWTWLVPLVLGWMAVGVQSRKNTVRDAIRGEIKRGEYAPLKALEAESGFIERPVKIHDALWCKVQGDEARQGPAYNYARILTYPKLRDRIVREFEEKLLEIHKHEAHVESPTPSQEGLELSELDHTSADDSRSTRSQAPPTSVENPRRIDTTEVERATTILQLDAPYMEWKDVRSSSDWKWNFVISNAVALFLQWGVTGSAVVISYLTEVRGLGCRSGSYLIYGVAATFAHVLLLASVFISHQSMLFYQRDRQNKPQDTAQEQSRRTLHVWVSRSAVFTRCLGKSIAVANAMWIILSSVFELIGFYESCWCTGTVFGLGEKAWVVLFVSGDKMRDDAEPSWIGGLAMSLLTMLFTYFLSKSYSRGR